MIFFFQREREKVQIAGLGCRSLGRGRVRSLGEGAGGGEGEGGEGVGGGRPSSASSIHTRLPIWSGAPRGDFLRLSKQHSCGVSTPGSDQTRHYCLWYCLWKQLSPSHFLLIVFICTLFSITRIIKTSFIAIRYQQNPFMSFIHIRISALSISLKCVKHSCYKSITLF